MKFKHASKKYYQQHELDQQQLNQLESLFCDSLQPSNESNEMIEDTSKVGKVSNKSWLRSTTIAASIMMVAFASLFFVPLYNQEAVITAIAEEVAKNHIKAKPLDVVSTQFSEVRAGLKKLEFSPIKSTVFEQLKLVSQKSQLLGARYCSIQTVTAAQVRYQDAEQHIRTLYQVPYDKNRFGRLPLANRGEAPMVRYALGLKVIIWVEKDLLMVATEMSNSANGAEDEKIHKGN